MIRGQPHSEESKERMRLSWNSRRMRDHNFWDRVTDTGFCWLFDTPNPVHGYGEVSINGTRWRAHRYAYEQLIGPIPKGLTLDHLCRIKLCVNPDHLEPVTAGENTLRGYTITGINARKTHCKRGHEFTLDNTAIRGKGRACRICERESQRGWLPIKSTEYCKRGHLRSEHASKNQRVRVCLACKRMRYQRAWIAVVEG